MPVSIRKTDGKYRVSTPNQTHAFGTTRKKAERQANLLRAIDHGWHPTGKPARESIHAEAQALVDALLDEVDEIGSLPLPASSKAYARIHGMRGLKTKQNLRTRVCRDLGNAGKPIEGFKNYDGSAYTGHKKYEGVNALVPPPPLERGQRLAIKGRPWGMKPGTKGRISRVFKPGEGSGYEAEFRAKGWHPMRVNRSDFGEAMDSAPVSQGLERHKTEKTKMGGGHFGKGVNPAGKTTGKFKFPGQWSVPHAMKT